MDKGNKKICLITGATSGIGLETAKYLAKQGFKLVLPVRDVFKGQSLRDELLQLAPSGDHDIMPCDLASLGSVRNFAAEFQRKYAHLHLLVNNAGIWEPKRVESADGIERNFAVNHLAPFLLTTLLLDTIRASAPARIVNVSSEAHRQGQIYFNDIEFKKRYSSLRSYSQSKLANILFTKKLSQKLKGSGVTVNCLHPGVVRTNLFSKMPGWMMGLFGWMLLTPEQGAQTTNYLAVSPEVDDISGEYFAKSRRKNPAPQALRQDIADKLWAISEKYVGIAQ